MLLLISAALPRSIGRQGGTRGRTRDASECLHDSSDRPPTLLRESLFGVAWELEQAGHHLPGANLYVSGDVPLGAGLISSAALEVAGG